MKKLTIFDHFPKERPCPVCGTSDDGKTVLVEIDGTSKDGIYEAVPVHLECAVVTNYNHKVGVMYLVPRSGK